MLGRQPQGSSKADLEADFLLNKHVFRTCAYTFAGFGLGLGASLLFFKNKAAMTAVCAGAGAGYGLAGFGSEWSNYKRFRSWMKNQTQQTRQGINYNQYAQSQISQQKPQQQRDEHKSSQQEQHKDQHRDERKTYQSKADNQSQEKSHQQRDEHKSSRQDQHKDEHKDERKTYQSKADNQSQEKSHQQRDEHKSSRQDQHKDEHKDERKTYQSKADNKGQQQQKQQRNTKEEPMNPEAKHKQDIAEQGRTLEREPGRVDTKMGQGRNFYTSTQDKAKRVEEAVYSQSMQGDKAGEDEVQRGEKGPQNTQIPPSQRDWTGGHANKGVFQQQVHRGAPESDKMGKSVRPDKEPNTNPDKGVPKQENQALSGVDFSGQKLQTFQSNPLPLGKAGPTHEIQKTYQEGRNRATDPDLDNVKRTIHGLEQDRMGQSIKEGIIHKVRERSPTEAGVGNYRPDVAEQNTKNQVNAVLE